MNLGINMGEIVIATNYDDLISVCVYDQVLFEVIKYRYKNHLTHFSLWCAGGKDFEVYTHMIVTACFVPELSMTEYKRLYALAVIDTYNLCCVFNTLIGNIVYDLYEDVQYATYIGGPTVHIIKYDSTHADLLIKDLSFYTEALRNYESNLR